MAKKQSRSSAYSLHQTLLLEFQFNLSGECVLVTRSQVPLLRPTCIVVIFSDGAFDVPGGLEIKGDLLFAVENEVDDWEQLPKEFASKAADLPSRDSYKGLRGLSITKLKSVAQLHRVIEHLARAASELSRLHRSYGR